MTYINLAKATPGKLYLFKSKSTFFDDKIGIFLELKKDKSVHWQETNELVILYKSSILSLLARYYIVKELI